MCCCWWAKTYTAHTHTHILEQKKKRKNRVNAIITANFVMIRYSRCMLITGARRTITSRFTIRPYGSANFNAIIFLTYLTNLCTIQNFSYRERWVVSFLLNSCNGAKVEYFTSAHLRFVLRPDDNHVLYLVGVCGSFCFFLFY